MSAAPITGRCLCGAVTITAVPSEGGVGACHCTMCQRWSGSVYMAFDAAPDTVTVSGEVSQYRSSGFATRAFCPTCGSHLWFRDDGDDKPYELLPGLFTGAADLPLTREVYADRALDCCRLAGEHDRIPAATYEARNPFVEGDDA